MGGDTNQWYPELVYDNHSIEQPTESEDGYHLSIDLADKAIEFIQDAHVNAPEKPFFLYYATGAGHAPHHVPKEWADKYKGKFDMGWDEYRKIVYERQLKLGLIPPCTQLLAHDPDVPEWNSLSDEEKRFSSEEVPEGEVSLRYEFEPTDKPDFTVGKGVPASGQLYINGKLVGAIEMPHAVPLVFGTEGCLVDMMAGIGWLRMNTATHLSSPVPLSELLWICPENCCRI